ncbi:MAG: hypothetical protein JST54_14400 [Deltaproteobacteria bacterium]|nr:hypothetical protein [Deltaproteobacteria bacterium]
MEATTWVREFQELHERQKQAQLTAAEEARWRELKLLLARQHGDSVPPTANPQKKAD